MHTIIYLSIIIPFIVSLAISGVVFYKKLSKKSTPKQEDPAFEIFTTRFLGL